MLAIVTSAARSVGPLGPGRPPVLEAALGPSFEVPRGTMLFRQLEPLNSVLLLQEGYAKTVQSFDDRDVIVSVRASGWLLGAISALSRASGHLLAAESLSKCILRSIPAERFWELARSDLTLCSWLLDQMAVESAHHLRLASFRGERAHTRLKRILIDLAQLDGRAASDGAVQIMVPVSRGDIASMIGVRAAPLSRMLAELETQGLIRRVRGRISIPKTSPLARYVGSRSPGGGGNSELALMWVNDSIDPGRWHWESGQRSSAH